MFSVLKKIMVFVFLILFVLTYTGINITKHTCASCQTTIYYIIAHADCCEGHYITHTQEADNCCSSHTQNQTTCGLTQAENCEESGCCSQEYLLIKASDHFVVNTAHYLPKITLLWLFDTLIKPINSGSENYQTELPLKTYRPPPLIAEGRPFYTSFHQLVFYA